MNRRDFLKAVTASVALVGAGQAGASVAPASWPLWMRRGSEEARFDAATREGFETARYLLRDIQGGGVKGLPHLEMLRTLSLTQSYFALYGVHSLFDATSGLRLPATNRSIEGAAQRSFHLPDKNGWFFATDFVPRGVPIDKAAGWMRYAGLGGIGIYPTSNFLHADVGPQRQWIKK